MLTYLARCEQTKIKPESIDELDTFSAFITIVYLMGGAALHVITLVVTPKRGNKIFGTQIIDFSQWVHVKDLTRKSHADVAIIKFQAQK